NLGKGTDSRRRCPVFNKKADAPAMKRGGVRVYSRAHILQVSLNLYYALVFGGCMSLSNFSKNSTEAGFTLVEIAIVLVIIGLLLGGVLKGQEMITQAKIKNIVNDFNGITVA